jgi:hypothetical protein
MDGSAMEAVEKLKGLNHSRNLEWKQMEAAA